MDVVGEGDALTADAIVASPDGRLDLIIRDLELAETRLGRDPSDAEKAVFQKIKACLESDQVVAKAGLTPEESQAADAHAFFTTKPLVVAEAPGRGEVRRIPGPGRDRGRLHQLPHGGRARRTGPG